MTFTPTEEQLAIVECARSTTDNILLSALAGAAKTSTLVLIAEAIADTQILCLAFNKRIADEMQERLPSNCRAMTLNSLGHRTWGEATGRRIRIESGKTYTILKQLVDECPRGDKDILYENFAELMRIVDFGKSCGYVPTGSYERAKRLMDDDDFFNHIEQKLTDLEIGIVRLATSLSLKQAFEGLCDYNDQILMPTVFHGAFPRYQLTLVDEAQDLSALNHATLRKMIGTRRLIAVGDHNQAIYGFRGAHQESMIALQREFNMKEMHLSISFRCPKSIVRHSHWRAPTMRWPEWAKEGEVKHLAKWTADDLPESATIICRNNAPLFGIAIKLLIAGRPVELHGKDVVASLTKVMRKFGGSDLRAVDVLDKINLWEEQQKAKNKPRAHGGIADRAECMRIFANQGSTLGDALAYAQHMVQMHSPLKMMTGHKAKGLEFDHVFFLDNKLVGDEEQEPNLRYVIITRAKETLTYINSDDMALSPKNEAIPAEEIA
jgi:DNA helicase-2/ATP-dependent DNA helicase PcrA